LHRDLRPENIQISSRGQAHLIDFGLARIDGEPQVTVRGQILRDHCWISPEFRRGGRLDARCDVYSLAAIAYYALTGAEPSEEYVPVREYIPDFSPRIDAVLAGALSLEPNERFHTAGQMAASFRIAVESRRAHGRFRLLPRWTWISSIIYAIACLSSMLYFRFNPVDAATHRDTAGSISKAQTMAKSGPSRQSHIP
jgi:serine/threonine protein kinase